MELILHTCCGPAISPPILILDTLKHFKVGRFTTKALALKSITTQTTSNNIQLQMTKASYRTRKKYNVKNQKYMSK